MKSWGKNELIDTPSLVLPDKYTSALACSVLLLTSGSQVSDSGLGDQFPCWKSKSKAWSFNCVEAKASQRGRMSRKSFWKANPTGNLKSVKETLSNGSRCILRTSLPQAGSCPSFQFLRFNYFHQITGIKELGWVNASLDFLSKPSHSVFVIRESLPISHNIHPPQSPYGFHKLLCKESKVFASPQTTISPLN